MQIKAKISLKDEDNIEVWSKGTVGTVEKTFRGYYMLNYIMSEESEGPIYKIADFTQEGTKAIDFNNNSVLSLE